MKKLLFLTIMLFASFLVHDTIAQPGKHKHKEGKGEKHAHKKGKNGGGPPPWAPAHGYRAKTRHVYFPDYETYYDVKKGVYITYKNGKWEFGANLPLPLQNVDLKLAQKVELDLNVDDPNKYFKEHKKKYPKVK